jgi:NAD(P)-dependent dehydrogenase (short-subunit alcohol dehydrogenase family)
MDGQIEANKGSADQLIQEVIVITGAGGMGSACARKLGSGRKILMGDVDDGRLAEVVAKLSQEGHAIVSQRVDICDVDSVTEFAETAEALGRIRTVIHTAGVSPSMASPQRVLEVDMVGMDTVLAAFLPLVSPGTVAVCIASMAGYLSGLTPEQERAIAAAPSEGLIALVGPLDDLPLGASYCIAKRVNHIRVERAAAAWGERGARVVSISPGIISTSMTQRELESASGDSMRMQLALSAIDRIGTPDDIAEAVQFLASPLASFITGCDLRIDGGVTPAVIALRAV